MDCATAKRLSIKVLGKPGASDVRRTVHGGGGDLWCGCLNTISGKTILHMSVFLIISVFCFAYFHY